MTDDSDEDLADVPATPQDAPSALAKGHGATAVCCAPEFHIDVTVFVNRQVPGSSQAVHHDHCFEAVGHGEFPIVGIAFWNSVGAAYTPSPGRQADRARAPRVAPQTDGARSAPGDSAC